LHDLFARKLSDIAVEIPLASFRAIGAATVTAEAKGLAAILKVDVLD